MVTSDDGPELISFWSSHWTMFDSMHHSFINHNMLCDEISLRDVTNDMWYYGTSYQHWWPVIMNSTWFHLALCNTFWSNSNLWNRFNMFFVGFAGLGTMLPHPIQFDSSFAHLSISTGVMPSINRGCIWFVSTWLISNIWTLAYRFAYNTKTCPSTCTKT